MPGRGVTTIGYCRVSTLEQASEGVSLDAQRGAIQNYCSLRKFTLADIVVDAGVSAGKPLRDRDGGQIVVDAVRRRDVQAVVAYKLDRLFRDAVDCLAVTRDWDQADVALHLIDLGGQALDTSSAMGRFFLTVMAGAAEMERNLVRERTRAAMAHKRTQGQLVGSVPYGYRLVGGDGYGDLGPPGNGEKRPRFLEEEPDEQKVVCLTRRLRARGLSLRAVARELSRRGYRSRAGKRFVATQVSRMLVNQGFGTANAHPD